ncbi:hypothetical protein J3D47_003257 [Pseudomonas laurylsulfativorans]|nr:hypothetical protein [Pseudomonas laurylsulfativorans]
MSAQVALISFEPPKPLWERACSRWRSVSQHQCRMYRPHREQARSHNVRGCPQISRPTQINCGSGLARDSAVSVNINAGCAGLIASRLASTMYVDVLRFRVRHRSTVGASLLAIAQCQSTSMLDVPASSRAGSLPQVSVVAKQSVQPPLSAFGKSLARNALNSPRALSIISLSLST